MHKMNILKWSIKSLVLVFIVLILMIIICNLWLINSTKKQIYKDIDQIPPKDVGLLLGTVRYLNSGYENLYFTYRIQAATDLYKKGKIKHILVSGDNHKHNYNEPESMKAALMENGIPEDAITLDFAGFRTLDSVVRGREVFQQDEFTIISQKFHNERAIFIANKYGIDAIAFNAKDVNIRYGKKVILREYLAKTKAVLDLYLLRTSPKFLGEKIKIIIK